MVLRVYKQLLDVLRECAHPTRAEHTKQNKHHLSAALQLHNDKATILTTSPYLQQPNQLYQLPPSTHNFNVLCV